MNNKRGVLGDLIISFPVIISVILIMGVCIFLAGVISLKAPETQDSYLKLDSRGVLFIETNVNSQRGILFEDILNAWEGDADKIIDLRVFLDDYFRQNAKDNECMFVLEDAVLAPRIIMKEAHLAASGNLDIQDSRRNTEQILDLLNKLSFRDKSGENRKVLFYYGKCPEVKNG